MFFAHTSCFQAWIRGQIIIFNCVIKYRIELILNCSKICWSIILFHQLVLPFSNIYCLNIGQSPFPEIGDDLLFDCIPFSDHRMLTKSSFHVLQINLHKIRKKHIYTLLFFRGELPIPLLCFSFCIKSTLC